MALAARLGLIHNAWGNSLETIRARFVAGGDEKYRIWDSYWRDSRIHSAGVDNDTQISDALDQQWAIIAASLPEGARVLDVGCGNGAASIALLRGAYKAGIDISVVGIDVAAIDPPRYVPEQADILKKIEFRAMVRMESLPFDTATFDLVIAQFALEYSNMRESLTEVLRVLKPHGLLSAMIMPARSMAVHSSSKNLKQCRFMLRESRLFDFAIQICRDLDHAHKMSPDADHGMIMTPFNVEVEQTVRRFGPEDCDVVLAMVLGLQKVLITRKETSVEEQIVAIQTLRTRLAEYGARARKPRPKPPSAMPALRICGAR